MSEDEDQPITEEDLARMFAEEDAQATATEEAPEPESEPGGPEDEPAIEPEPPVGEPEPEEQPGLEPGELPGEEPIPDGVEEALAEHLAWAERRNLVDFEAAAKLAWEQEKFLGRRASEIQELQEQLAAYEQQQPEQITPEWIAQAIGSPDPGRFAYELAANDNWTAYSEMMQAWESIAGPAVTMAVHNQIVTAIQEQQAQPAPEAEQGANVRAAFQQVGIIDLDNDPLRPMLMQIADELGGQDPLIESLARGDANAAHALVRMAQMRTVTTRTVRLDGSPVDESRQAAARVAGQGSAPSRTPPPKNPFAAEEEEWRRMGVLPVE
jgi:hypothetical protein